VKPSRGFLGLSRGEVSADSVGRWISVRSRGGSWLGCQGFLGLDMGSRGVSRGGFRGWISGMGFGDVIRGAASGLSRVLTLFFFSAGPWGVH
jgi:hypothetical protein